MTELRPKLPGVPEHWIPHRREDGELVGWIDMTSAEPALVPIDRLGRPGSEVPSWDVAEQAVEESGLAVLMGKFTILEKTEERPEGTEVTVRISNVYEDRIVLSTALTDAIEEVGREIVVPFPAPDSLKPVRP